MVALNTANNLGKIVKAKPHFQSTITEKLLNLDRTHHKHKELLKSGAIKSFMEYFKEAENKKKIMAFVKQQQESKSPKTKRIAEEFIKRFEN